MSKLSSLPAFNIVFCQIVLNNPFESVHFLESMITIWGDLSKFFFCCWDIPTNRSISPRPRWKPRVVLLIMIKSGMTYLGEMTIVTLAVLAFQRWHWTNILWKVLKKSNRIMEMKPFNNFLSVLCIIEENHKLCYLVQNLFMSLYISL